MSVATLAPPKSPPQPLPIPDEQRLVLYGVDWASYTRFLEAAGKHRIRLTYDQGTLELMTLSSPHEWWRRRFGFVLPLLGGLLGIGVQGYGSTTLRRQDRERGLEPDEGFYVGTALSIRGPRPIDLTRDPPPNLAIEIDISRSSLNRLAIYAALRIAEVWRFDGQTILIHRLLPDGEYELCQSSEHFPSLPLVELVGFLHQTRDLLESELIIPSQEWVRERVLAGSQGTGTDVS